MTDQSFFYATPESQGVPSKAIISLIEELEKERIGIDSIIIARHDRIIAEGYWKPFKNGDYHRLFSAAKALAGTAILIAAGEGLISLDDKVTDLFRDCLPPSYDPKYDDMTVYNMLTMHTGHSHDPFYEMLHTKGNRATVFFEQPLPYAPGTHFLYDNGVPDMLGLILYRKTGQCVSEYLQTRLVEPCGMDPIKSQPNGDLDELPTMTWTTRSLFRLTWLYFHHGKWNGKQIIPEKLADQAVSYQVSSLQSPEPDLVAYDTKFGYGFQIWRNSVGGFRIDGGRGQFGIGLPEMDMIIAVNATEQDQSVIPIEIWKHLTNRLYSYPLPEDPAAQKQLEEKLESLTWAEKGTDLPQPLTMHAALSEESFGISDFSLRIDNTHRVFLKTSLTEKELCLGQAGSGEWTQVSVLPFETPEHFYGSGAGKESIAGGKPSYFANAFEDCSGNLFLQFRSGTIMGGKIFVIDIPHLTLRYLPYDDFARARRSSAVKHKNLDRLAVSGQSAAHFTVSGAAI